MMKKLRLQNGMTLVELMMVVLITSAMIAGGMFIFTSGQATWFTTDATIRLQENLRRSLERMAAEFRQSQVGRVTLMAGTGPNNTDVIRFSIPILCKAGTGLLDVNGDIAYWGAPLTWGCTSSTCMDADDDCLTLDYSAVEYGLDNSNRLIRRVLNAGNATVRQDIMALNIIDFQIVANGELYTFDVKAQETSENNRIVSARVGTSIDLRN